MEYFQQNKFRAWLLESVTDKNLIFPNFHDTLGTIFCSTLVITSTGNNVCTHVDKRVSFYLQIARLWRKRKWLHRNVWKKRIFMVNYCSANVNVLCAISSTSFLRYFALFVLDQVQRVHILSFWYPLQSPFTLVSLLLLFLLFHMHTACSFTELISTKYFAISYYNYFTFNNLSFSLSLSFSFYIYVHMQVYTFFNVFWVKTTCGAGSTFFAAAGTSSLIIYHRGNV